MPTVLLVDDDNSIRLLFQRLLRAKGYRVIGTAKNGREAVELYRSLPEKPDLVLMDHRMPIKNGIDATKEILTINRDAKIIFASADSSIRDLALSNGAIDFLVKPFKFHEVINVMHTALLV
jgi:two-component system chemotaxis response regulator CheY